MDACSVMAQGNFEGKNILYRTRDTAVLAKMPRMGVDEVERKLATRKREGASAMRN